MSRNSEQMRDVELGPRGNTLASPTSFQTATPHHGTKDKAIARGFGIRAQDAESKAELKRLSAVKRKYHLSIHPKKIRNSVNLTREIVLMAGKIFKKFDKDQSGTLSLEEFKQALMEIKHESASKASMAAIDLINEIHQQGLDIHSKNDLQEVNFDEFLSAILASQDAHYGDNGFVVKDLIEQAGMFYGFSKGIQTFYAPQKKDFTESYVCWPPPLLFVSISVLLLFIFAHYVENDNRCHGERLGSTSLECPLVFDSIWAYHYDAAYKNEWWRFITYMALHASASHIASNIFLQLIVGLPLEMAHGPWRILLLYVLGGLAGTCCVSMFDEKTNVVGASAGCYALVGAHVANIINYWSIMPYAWFRTLFFGLLFVADVGIAAYQKYHGQETSVSYSAHMGGALLGLALGTYVLDEIEHHENIYWRYFKNYFGLTATIVCFFVALMYNLITPQET